MKVLYISTSFTALSHSFITREINELRNLGVQVDLLSIRTPDTTAASRPECDLDGCRFIYPAPFLATCAGVLATIFRSPRRFWRALRMVFRASEDSLGQKVKLFYQFLVCCRHAGWVRRLGIQHIHSHFAGSPTSFAMFLATLNDCPFTFTDHGAGVYHDRIGLTTKFREAGGISAISEFNLQFYPQVVPTVPPFKIVRCGLDLAGFDFRQRRGCRSPLRILSVSRIVPKKGYTHLLDGLAVLDREGVTWECTLVGEGPLVPALQEQARRLGLAERIVWTGPLQQDEIRLMMSDADVFVLPCVVAPDGDMDGIPVTLMEAMACGCPVISTRISGVPELVIDEKAGLLLEPEDGEAVGQALVRLARDPELTARLSAGGREWVAEEFNIKKSARRQAEFFHEVAEKHQGR